MENAHQLLNVYCASHHITNKTNTGTLINQSLINRWVVVIRNTQPLSTAVLPINAASIHTLFD